METTPLPPSAGISRFRFNGSWGATPTSQPLGSPGMGGRLGRVAGAVEGGLHKPLTACVLLKQYSDLPCLTDIRKTYGRKTALDDVSCTRCTSKQIEVRRKVAVLKNVRPRRLPRCVTRCGIPGRTMRGSLAIRLANAATRRGQLGLSHLSS